MRRERLNQCGRTLPARLSKTSKRRSHGTFIAPVAPRFSFIGRSHSPPAASLRLRHPRQFPSVGDCRASRPKRPNHVSVPGYIDGPFIELTLGIPLALFVPPHRRQATRFTELACGGASVRISAGEPPPPDRARTFGESLLGKWQERAACLKSAQCTTPTPLSPRRLGAMYRGGGE